MQPLLDFDQLQPRFRDPVQRRYEIIRPLVLFPDRTAAQRAQETHTHPETVGTLKRRFEPQGMLGLLPDHVEIVTPVARGESPTPSCASLSDSKASTAAWSTANCAGSSLPPRAIA